MAKCKICGKPLTTGIVVCNNCYEQCCGEEDRVVKKGDIFKRTTGLEELYIVICADEEYFVLAAYEPTVLGYSIDFTTLEYSIDFTNLVCHSNNPKLCNLSYLETLGLKRIHENWEEDSLNGQC